MPKVVVTDYTFDALDVETAILQPFGFEIVAWKEKRPAADLAKLVADADAVITQFAPVNAEVIAAMTRARVIVRYGIGVDNVDLEAARAKGIPVCNVPDYCIDEVADQTLAFILGITRQIVPNTRALEEGGWKLAVPLASMKALRDLTIGIVGCGRIGREVLHRLLPFKCRMLGFDPAVDPEEVASCGATSVTFEQLIAESDVISLHCPSTPKTRRMMNRDVFGRMKQGAALVNVARGDLVEPAALREALESGQLGAAALDVYDPEPIPADDPIRKRDNVLLSAHIASTSVKAVRKLRESAARIVEGTLCGEGPINVVNGVTSSKP
jgi:D-3-phosphoglycerate dehydrogenase / 2-oxoglutarate reductase